jgi:thiosulfate dehydrogenase (quinone) large subunit
MQPSFWYSFLNRLKSLEPRLGLNHPATAWLIPTRGFIAIGWLRACAEKIADPNWSSGETLKNFLETQQDLTPFPFYSYLVQHVFLQHLPEMAFIVLLGQWLVGLGILFGAWTRLALLGGIFMNLNFLLIGRPDPNVFYCVIQWILCVARADRVMSFMFS